MYIQLTCFTGSDYATFRVGCIQNDYFSIRKKIDCISWINVYKYLNVVWFNSITVYTYRIRDCIPKPKSKYIYIYTCGMTSLMYIEIVWFREGSLTPSAVVALS